MWKSPDTPLVAPAELTPARTVDYDTDDGLIEVSSLAQLDAVRWDANGDGYSDHGGPLHIAFPNALLGMGCPTSGCVGYEPAADLGFDTNAGGDADSGDDYWNSRFADGVPVPLEHGAVVQGARSSTPTATRSRSPPDTPRLTAGPRTKVSGPSIWGCSRNWPGAARSATSASPTSA